MGVECTLEQLAIAVPDKAIKTLQMRCEPLSKGVTLPERKNLSRFWKTAEKAIAALGKGIHPSHLGPSHIENLAPVILGGPIWALLDGRDYFTWEDLKKVVEFRFGMTDD